MYGSLLNGNVAHHPIPLTAPHPTGWLTYSDALERSCNIFFESLAQRLGMDGLHFWYDRFGLGRPTGVGISEFDGMLPGDKEVPAYLKLSATWYSGIGQSQVLATPIQMANVAATIARNGIWMRPRLVPAGTKVDLPTIEGPDRVDLHLSEPALAAAKVGMINVVNGPAGTGKALHRDDILVAGKTGSATAQPLTTPKKDGDGNVIYKTIQVPKTDPATGKTVFVERKVPERDLVQLGTHEHESPDAKWYRGGGEDETQHTHAWFIGFAPADNPQIAFAVMVEYGWGGGSSAAQVASRMLDACIKHKYLSKRVKDEGGPMALSTSR
jgi:cell division protein FtsI/penicillin-binding protein 2